MEKTYSTVPQNERLEEIACPLCGGSARSRWLSGEGFLFVRCASCSLVYQSPRPVFDDLRKRYAGGYFSYELSNERNFFNLMMLGLRDVRFESRTEALGRPRMFLDIGCATGMLVEEMKRRGWESCGVDLCRQSAEYGTKTRGVPIFGGTLEEARFAAGSFAAVHFSHLIEHVPDPRGLLDEVRRVLAPGGLAVITTPNIDGLQARLFGVRWRSAIADHLTLWSPRTLGALVAEAGFVVEKTVTWGGLAVGTAPLFLKKPADYLAKKLGFGDVMMFLARRE